MSIKKSNEIKLQVGTSSILLIFVIVCLVSFATLAIVSANADNKLSEKVATRTLSYYEACNLAEMALGDLDTNLAQAYEQAAGDPSAYISSTGDYPTVYEYPLAQEQILRVKVEICYPQSKEDHFLKILEYKVVNLSDME